MGQSQSFEQAGDGFVGVIVDELDGLSVLLVDDVEVDSVTELLGDATEVPVIEFEGRACCHSCYSFSLGEVRTPLRLSECED